jgi:hypothetical protein
VRDIGQASELSLSDDRYRPRRCGAGS